MSIDYIMDDDHEEDEKALPDLLSKSSISKSKVDVSVPRPSKEIRPANGRKRRLSVSKFIYFMYYHSYF
jgi:hypothetical protein